MAARWAWALAVCACAAAAPAEPPCDPLLLRNPPPPPANMREHEAAVVHTARALAELVEQGAADEARAAALARAAVRAPLGPPPAAVALGAPQLHLGVLYIADPPRLHVFQQNNSAGLQQFWKTLASAWNETGVLWSNAWSSCEKDGWWSGAAAARGAGATRAAAAIFRRSPTMLCEEAMYEWMAKPPACDNVSTVCEASLSKSSERQLEYRCSCGGGLWALLGRRGECAACAGGEGGAGGAGGCLPADVRALLLAANLLGVLLCLVMAVLVFHKRKCKAVAMGMWTVLEVVLVGALMIYASAASQYLSSAWWRCVAGAWLRELGFVACYGSVVLRLWVLLAEFRTRKAHRWTPRDSEVLRIVAAMVLGAGCYLAAFSATAACGECSAAWHHATAAAELLLLLAGLRLAVALRSASVPFQERCWLVTALVVEAIVTTSSRLLALVGGAPESHALVAAARAQLSAGAALLCVPAPRLWHAYRARALAQEVSRRGPAEGFPSSAEEEPTSLEVRAELRRLYVELELLRNKTLRRDNPHISRRRGGRKPPHRRFSLQALQARRGGKGKAAGGSSSVVEASDVDPSRTPEDSVCSNEGPSHYTEGETQQC